MVMFSLRIIMGVLAISFLWEGNVFAQTEPESPEVEQTIQNNPLESDPNQSPIIADMMTRSSIMQPGVRIDQISSLFFTIYEENLIKKARLGFETLAPTDQELLNDLKVQEGNVSRNRGPRELSVGGIVYVSANEWTVWLNGQKITPEILPKEVLDIRVYRDSIKLKWYDEYTNQIFPIKIKTHQRFNVDTRIFLPG